MKEAWAPWLDIQWLTQGVPLKLPSVTHTVCSDASAQGWGSHLIPSGDLVSGQCLVRLKVNHISPSGDQVSGQCSDRLK